MAVTNLDDLGLVVKTFPETPTITTISPPYGGATAGAIDCSDTYVFPSPPTITTIGEPEKGAVAAATSVADFNMANALVPQAPIEGLTYP